VRLGTLCATRLDELFPEVTVTVGIGGPCHGPEQIRHSYAQARRTVEGSARTPSPR
jgi:sugar diacid utilization regulator